MVQAPVAPDHAAQRLAAEIFLTSAGPALVKSVAEILGAQRIPVMPLKGVLLQRLVYRDKAYRPISDVDLLVPEARFVDAYRTLHSAGFSGSRWEIGAWQVTINNPHGPPLGIDLHRRLTRTSRSRLTPAGLFERGTPDTQLFGTTVVIPSAEDLFAHLLLHAALHWLNLGGLHHAQDFQAVADSLRLDVDVCAEHLRRQGLLAHALLMLPLIAQAIGSPVRRHAGDANRTPSARGCERPNHRATAALQARASGASAGGPGAGAGAVGRRGQRHQGQTGCVETGWMSPCA